MQGKKYELNIISSTDRIRLDPPFGNREGGSGVVVSGPTFISTDNVTCIFDDEEVNGVVLSDENAVLCITPRLSRTGRIPVMIRHNQILLQKQAYFYSGKNTVHVCTQNYSIMHFRGYMHVVIYMSH